MVEGGFGIEADIVGNCQNGQVFIGGILQAPLGFGNADITRCGDLEAGAEAIAGDPRNDRYRDEKLVGLLSIDDLARALAEGPLRKAAEVTASFAALATQPR